MKHFGLIVLLSVFILNLPAQNIVHADEIYAAAKFAKGRAVADSVLRIVSIGEKYNVGVSVVSRSKINGKTPADAIIHDVVTEVYQIIKGKGILLVGGTLDSSIRIPANSPIVIKIAGPGSMGKHITGGTQYEVGPGDIVIIPPKTPHGFIELKTNSIDYTLIRIDTEKVLELKN